MREVKLEVYGKVQGVGFRFLTLMLANELNITGTVSNRDDGSVYIEAIGDNKKIETFIDKIKASLGPASQVDRVVVHEDATIKKSNNFRII